MASTFCNVNPDDIAYVDIFPPVGVSRVGDSSEHFLAPEVPGVEAIPDGGFKDKDFKIKKQVARFRAYAFGKDGKVLGEITTAHYDLKWTVHIASKKAAWVLFRGKYRTETWQLRNKTVQGWPNGTPPEGTPQSRYDYTNTRTQLIIDSGERVIEGANTKDVFLDGVFGKDSDKIPHTQVRLGELRTDDQGHLLVLASDGDSFSVFGSPHQDLHSKFDNDGWVDKMADGTVRVTVKSKSKPDLDIPVKNRATVITAPPRFASGTHCPTSLYELIEEVYERRLRREPNYNVGDVVYYRDIYPLFKRIYLLSWTNQSAADGHGSTQMDYFDNPELADPQADNSARVALFKRIRDPVIDGDQQNEQTRNKQAFSRFMPQLSGDGGDAQPRVRDSWASLTQRQWALLKKWSEGQFTTGKPEVPYGSFNEIPLDEQPSALTRSALEWSIGAPLYPGIECFWHAQQDEMYKPGDRFRFADTVTPGDLGKGLSLPWQSDFNMCNTNWWPSVRPDDVVTEAYFQQVQQASPPEQLASNLTDRSEWARGVNTNSDMVRGWNKLGFVAKQPYGDSPNLPEILVEKQRSTSIAPL